MSKFEDLINNADKALGTSDSIVSMDFIRSHAKHIVATVILLLLFTSLRYQYEGLVADVAKLKKELNDVRYTSIEKWGILTTRHNRQALKKKVEENNIKLIESDEPAVSLD